MVTLAVSCLPSAHVSLPISVPATGVGPGSGAGGRSLIGFGVVPVVGVFGRRRLVGRSASTSTDVHPTAAMATRTAASEAREGWRMGASSAVTVPPLQRCERGGSSDISAVIVALHALDGELVIHRGSGGARRCAASEKQQREGISPRSARVDQGAPTSASARNGRGGSLRTQLAARRAGCARSAETDRRRSPASGASSRASRRPAASRSRRGAGTRAPSAAARRP